MATSTTPAEQSTPLGESLPNAMRAVVQPSYGPAPLLRVEEIERPDIEPNEVLVRVHSASVDRGTWHLMTGRPYLIRVAGFGLRAPKNPVLGRDLAGTVAAVGAEVTRFQVGDEVLGIGEGSLAEYARAAEDKLVAKPLSLSFDGAATVSVSGLTALQALQEVGHVEPGQEVLVIGASGGVGTYAVQIARALGASVTGVASSAKLDLVRALGATRAIDYTRDDFADGAVSYDLIIDIGGNSSLRRLRRALTTAGTLVIVGGEEGGSVIGGVDRQLRAMMLSPLVGQRLTTFISKENRGLDDLVDLIEAGQVAPVVDRTYPLERAPDALRLIESGKVRGKVAITVRGS